MRRKWAAAAFGAALCLTLIPATAVAVARPLLTGFASPSTSADLDRAAAAGAGIVRIDASWAGIATRKPAKAADPGDPAYSFSRLDRTVRAVRARGLEPVITFFHAPRWAEGAHRPKGATAGTWKPKPGDVRDFAHALAMRYSGGYAPPRGSALPLVRHYQVWNEPNLPDYLEPQWRQKKPASPLLYRRILNAAYAGIKSARGADRVITAGTAPYGDPPGVDRMRPLLFLRKLLCLRGRGLRAAKCRGKAHLDVLAHHPITTSGGPRKHAINRDDAAIADLHKVRAVLRAAERHGTVLPRRRGRQLWVTEFWWDSKPPNRQLGIPTRRFARWIEEGLNLMWKQGASVAINLQVRDAPYHPSHPGATLQSGVFFHDGRKKLAFRTFSFPFVTHRRSNGTIVAWGRAPAAGQLEIQRKAGGGWRTLKSVSVRSGRRGAVFNVRVGLRGRAMLRGVVAGRTSLPWLQRG